MTKILKFSTRRENAIQFTLGEARMPVGFQVHLFKGKSHDRTEQLLIILIFESMKWFILCL
jgi:hypothetical protein